MQRHPLITELSYLSNCSNSRLIIQGLPSVTNECVIMRLFSRSWWQAAYEELMLFLINFYLEQIKHAIGNWYDNVMKDKLHIEEEMSLGFLSSSFFLQAPQCFISCCCSLLGSSSITLLEIIPHFSVWLSAKNKYRCLTVPLEFK